MSAPAMRPRPEPGAAPQVVELIDVYFNKPGQPMVLDQLYADIQGARQAVVLASAWLTDTTILRAFLDARVAAKLLILNALDLTRESCGLVQHTIEHHRRLRVRVAILGSGQWSEGVMHHKFLVVDRAVVWTGSYNFTFQARKNYEGLVRLASPRVARLFTDEAERLWERARHAGPFVHDGPQRCVRCGLTRVSLPYHDRQGQPLCDSCFGPDDVGPEVSGGPPT